MLLTDKQQEVLTRFIKIALSRRTAASLSHLIGSPVVLEVAEVALYPLSFLHTEFTNTLQDEVAVIRHSFEGGINGDALLSFDYHAAVQLTNLLQTHGMIYPLDQLNLSACEVLTEVGNILLTAYLRMLDQLLGQPITFGVPSFEMNSMQAILNHLILSRHEVRYVLLVKTTFRLCDTAVDSYMMLVSGVASLSSLIRGIEASFCLHSP
ncbi:chemotaxis protein CheC [Spirulina subsalsa FACHB-351]|uniref:Chemotaxis protein CheC n=1 Tax=Spirulina subsalsa FACHB-351 TaxID=234711 RepID=A0ABT3L948_9CYAN|nr:chemotaxis protein CheC [Spirulina subsalsa]MCW6037982.1 chemotaxis protein CheC [Spirulina subsalsa FACHB-351]